MKKQSGFTLIELMVVMAIIAILATAGLTAYSNYLKKARDSSRLQVARQLMTTVESLSNGGAIPTVAALTAFMESEGFAYRLPTMNPMIARVSGVIDTVLGTAFALPDLDPLSGQGQCISGLCGFIYVKYSDNTYLIGYGIEHTDSVNHFYQFVSPNINSPLYVAGLNPIENLSGFASWHANFIGTTESIEQGPSGTVEYTKIVEAEIISDYTLFVGS